MSSLSETHTPIPNTFLQEWNKFYQEFARSNSYTSPAEETLQHHLPTIADISNDTTDDNQAIPEEPTPNPDTFL